MNISRLQSLTKELIAIDSVTGREGQIGAYLQAVLHARGMQVQTFPVSKDRHNILAFWDKPAKIRFNTHIDTVPEPYGPHEDDDRIYGRGACDTHGILAAQLEALDILHQEGVKGLGLLLVVGEERDHDGAIHAGTCREITEPKVLIVGEPTENKLMQSQKGRLKGEVSAFGLEGHSGYPEQFDSAVEKLHLFLQALWTAPWVKTHSDEGTTVNVITNQAGDADNKIPALAQATLMFRCAQPVATIKKKVAAILRNVENGLPSPRTRKPHFELKWQAAANDPITGLATLPDFETGHAAFNTDIAYFGWKSCQTFLVGPGSILQAHKDLKGSDWLNGEWISKEEQIAGVNIYLQLVRALRSKS